MDRARLRLRIVAVLFSIGFVIVLGRALYLAFGRGESPGADRRDILRGAIQDRRGFTLAITEEASSIGIAPPEVQDVEFTAENLARRLDMPVEEVLQRLYVNQNRRYFLLKRQVDNLTADQIVELRLPGVHREREYRRAYPGGSLASNLLGFVGRDQAHALAGLERDYNETLISGDPAIDPAGPTLRLTIDALVQHRLEQELASAFESSNSKRAAGMFMDVNTGAIIAMASLPNFDPNFYYRSNAFQRGNWNIRLNYEPGSTMKVFMAAILLNENAVRPNERFLCEGELHFHNSVVACRSRGRVVAHGALTLREIIQNSCNVGIIKAMQRIPRSRLYYYMNELDFGIKTEVLPPGSGETQGYFPEEKNWVPSTTYYMPIGQGFSITPIQLLRAGASLANGGRLVRPLLVSRIVAPDGRVLDQPEPDSRAGPFRAEVNRAVAEMMRLVVTRGTGRAANTPTIAIAGKTGTGEKSSATGYLDKYVASFLGFFPADNPRFVGLILFDEPQGAESGGSLAAPVFARVAESALDDFSAESDARAAERLTPLPEHPPRINPAVMYDLRGLAARDALTIVAGYYQLPVEIRGGGYVVGQTPPPGTRMDGVRRITLYLDDLR